MKVADGGKELRIRSWFSGTSTKKLKIGLQADAGATLAWLDDDSDGGGVLVRATVEPGH